VPSGTQEIACMRIRVSFFKQYEIGQCSNCRMTVEAPSEFHSVVKIISFLHSEATSLPGQHYPSASLSMDLQGIFVMFAHHFRAKISHFRTQYIARTPSCASLTALYHPGCLVPSCLYGVPWVPGMNMYANTIMFAWYHPDYPECRTILSAWYHQGCLVPICKGAWYQYVRRKKRVAQKWSNSLNELLRGLMSYLLADGSD
jgi:hypothetical protein